MPKILFLEDDPILGEAIRLQLELEGYEVTWARSVREASEKSAQEKHGFYLLDVNLPDKSGFDFCRELRERGIKEPVMFLTARSEEEDVVKGFGLGADDYMRKPFGKMELLARVRHQMGEKRAADDNLRYGDATLLKNQQALKYKEELIALNRREFEILLTFFERPESIVTRELLLSRLSAADDIFDRTIDSHISHIRGKLRKKGVDGVRINSVYGTGYRLEKN